MREKFEAHFDIVLLLKLSNSRRPQGSRERAILARASHSRLDCANLIAIVKSHNRSSTENTRLIVPIPTSRMQFRMSFASRRKSTSKSSRPREKNIRDVRDIHIYIYTHTHARACVCVCIRAIDDLDNTLFTHRLHIAIFIIWSSFLTVLPRLQLIILILAIVPSIRSASSFWSALLQPFYPIHRVTYRTYRMYTCMYMATC